MRTQSPLWVVITVFLVFYQDAAALTTRTDAGAYKPDTVIIKLREEARVSATGLGLPPPKPLSQFVTLSVPEGRTVEEYISALATSEGVEYAEPNYLIRLLGNSSSDPLLSQQYHLSMIDALDAWKTRTDASSVKVCIIDTGADRSQADLVGNLSPLEFNSVENNTDAFDLNGHGTLVAGIVGARGNNSLMGSGVAWRAQLLACKIFPKDSEAADVDSALKCLQWCISKGAQVSSNSWGTLRATTPSRTLYDIINAANAAGHVVVFAAGNDGIDMDNSDAKVYPAVYADLPNLISVASTNRKGEIAGLTSGPGLSNYGTSTVTIAAPGVDILSTSLKNKTAAVTGTSFAAPQVVGAVALLQAEAKARGLSLQPCHYKALLMRTAKKTPELKDKVQADGLLDVQAALQALVEGDIPSCSWLNTSAAGFPAPATPPDAAPPVPGPEPAPTTPSPAPAPAPAPAPQPAPAPSSLPTASPLPSGVPAPGDAPAPLPPSTPPTSPVFGAGVTAPPGSSPTTSRPPPMITGAPDPPVLLIRTAQSPALATSAVTSVAAAQAPAAAEPPLHSPRQRSAAPRKQRWLL